MRRSRPVTDPVAGDPASGTPATPAGDASPPQGRRPDWIDSFTLGADLALVGVAILVCALPVVTAAGGVATASVALDHWLDHRRWPPFAELAATFRRAVLPGIGVTAVVLVVAAVLRFDVAGLATGAVPGGRPVLFATLAVTAMVAAFGALTVVEVGRRDGRHWSSALGAASRAAYRQPILPLAIAGSLVPAAIIGWLVPITLLVLPGFTLFAAHVVDRRLHHREL